MAYENTAGLNVNNQYGARNTGGAVGRGEDDMIQFLTYDMTGEMINSGFFPKVVMPKGAKVLRAFLRVDEVFSLSSGPLAIGGTIPGTNGVALTKTQLEAVGTKDVGAVAVGTWATASATGTTAAELVTKALTGTATNVGKGALIVEYLHKTKV